MATIINGRGRVGVRTSVGPGGGGGGGSIVTSGLILNLDAGNPASYPGTGTVWTDLSGQGNNATLVNGVGYSSNNNGYLTFDGTNDYVSTGIGSLRTWAGNQNSISIWFLTNNSLTRQVLLGDWDSGGQNESCRVEISGWSMTPQRVGGWYNFTDQGTIQSSTNIQNNTWYNVVMQYNGVNTQVYLNGTLEGNSPSNAVGSAGNGFTSIGRAGAVNALFMNGNISVVQVYNRGLSQAEITQNFDALKSRYGL